jgi:hypothetical protein
VSRSRKKAEHAVPATTLSAGQLVMTTFATTARTAPSLLALVVLTQGPWALLEAAGVFDGASDADHYRWGGLYGLVAGVLHSGAVIWLVHGALQGEGRSAVDSLLRAASRYFSLLGASLQSAIFTLLYLLLLVVPGVLKALSYAVVLPVVMLEDKNASASLARSTQLMDGHRGAVLLAMCVALPLAIGPGALGLVLPSLQESALARAGAGLLEGVLALPLEVMGVVLYVEAVRAYGAFRREVFGAADTAS